MIFVVDVGNSHTVFGFVNEKMEVVKSYRLPTDIQETDGGYAIKISALFDLAGINVNEIEDTIISSVAPAVTKSIKKAMWMLTGNEPIVLGTFDTGLDISAIPGGMIAPDLEAGAIAVKHLYPLPCIVVDMGTATTVTVVDSNGAYKGGVIMPGAGTAIKALVAGTSLLPDIDITAPKNLIAVDTVPSMQAGLVYGSAGAIDGIVDRFVEEMDEAPNSIVVTGGLGKLICKYCKHEMIFDDDLLLKGLFLIWQDIKRKR